ncbi:MAG: hypothetical protein PHF46_03265 [Candidatus Gracilibacteria bacterium]|nr:hypothetical protein [Candidatus Gracilibacteria bacterium]MDD3120399.1 hypothetical protein [Candidatus Gracilibacteria bacterium]MDD4530718.1 hypothetical protein [Candidatus Gracilibacteria bacterium]
MILITETFEKSLKKIRSVSINSVISEIKKHKKGLDIFVSLYKTGERTVLKGYLLSSKVRILILFHEKNGNYMPFALFKKETKDGYNITKADEDFLNSLIKSNIEDIRNGKYKIIQD